MIQVGLQARLSIAGALGAALLAAIALGTGSVALGQDQSAATPKDVIFARKILMGSIGSNMDEIDTAMATQTIDLAHLQGHADSISVALLVFPHLFPSASNEWKAGADRDPGTDTFASPEVWTRFAEFYKLAAEGSKAAYNTSRAQTPEEFKKFGAELRANCDTCHAAFLKTD
jgi:cytochrome c556